VGSPVDDEALAGGVPEFDACFLRFAVLIQKPVTSDATSTVAAMVTSLTVMYGSETTP